MTTEKRIELSDKMAEIAHKIRILENMIEETESDAIKLRKTSPFFSEVEHKTRIIQMQTLCLELELEWIKLTSNVYDV